jgi:protein O-mannosyl-transferase
MQRPRPEPAPDSPKPRGKFLFYAVLLAATLLVYWQVWDFFFISIDDPLYPSNPFVQAGLCAKSFRWSLGIRDCNWIPLTWWSLMLDSTLFGIGPTGYHITNVLLHAANTLILFATLATATGNRSRSAFVAVLFAIHPLHVESVAWVAERKDVLSIFFGLLAIRAYVGYAKQGRAWRLVAAFVFFALSLASKPTLVTLPFVLLLLDYWPLARLYPNLSPAPADPQVASASRGGKRGRTARTEDSVAGTPPNSTTSRLLVEKIPFFVGSAAFSLIALYAQSSGGAMRAHFSLATRLGNAIVAYLAYLEKTAYPVNLAVFYPHPDFELAWTSVALAGLVLAAVSIAAILLIRRYPFLFVGWFWYLGTLVPMIGLVQVGVQQMADRYTYFPLIGIFLAVTWLVPELTPAGFFRERVLPITAVAAVALYSAMAFGQVSYWHDSLTLLRHSESCTPQNVMIHNCLGAALFREGKPAEAATEFKTAIRLSRPDAILYNGLAASYLAMGRKDEALEQYRLALALEPNLTEPLIGMASILIERGQLDEARRDLERARALDPDNALIYSNLASAAIKSGDFAQALSLAEEGLAKNPRLYLCDFYAAQALRGLGRFDEAIRRLERVLETAPGNAIVERELKLAREHQKANPSRL